jgi:sporadic carbohydrate cluster 2OG-Fe(II) oxygenase
MFFTDSDRRTTDEYLHKGYIIRPVADLGALNWIRSQIVRLIGEISAVNVMDDASTLLNGIHTNLDVFELNEYRLKLIRGLNSTEGFREMYFRVARPYLETLVGNELAMQLRVNLSIQLPNDNSSLLPVHADTWSGDSPFEVVVWLPLVDCYRTKAMYFLSPQDYEKLSDDFSANAGGSSEALYQSIKHNVKWLDVRYGEVLLFDQSLPHGNRINEEQETRWSMNCRFKGVFTPYGDKKIGEFFAPITLRAASQCGMAYRLPTI